MAASSSSSSQTPSAPSGQAPSGRTESRGGPVTAAARGSLTHPSRPGPGGEGPSSEATRHYAAAATTSSSRSATSTTTGDNHGLASNLHLMTDLSSSVGSSFPVSHHPSQPQYPRGSFNSTVHSPVLQGLLRFSPHHSTTSSTAHSYSSNTLNNPNNYSQPPAHFSWSPTAGPIYPSTSLQLPPRSNSSSTVAAGNTAVTSHAPTPPSYHPPYQRPRTRFFDTSTTAPPPRALSTHDDRTMAAADESFTACHHPDPRSSSAADPEKIQVLAMEESRNTTGNTDATTGVDAENAESSHHSIVDGLDLIEMRQMATQALLVENSPQQARFFAQLLYAKSPQPPHAILLARCLLACQQYPAVLRTLEESSSHPAQGAWWMQHALWQWEALLLAAAALSAMEDWFTLAELLQDACRLPDHNNNSHHSQQQQHFYTQPAMASFSSYPFPPAQMDETTAATMIKSQSFTPTLFLSLDDDDSIGWQNLQQSVPWPPTAHDSMLGGVGGSGGGAVHPLARVCCYRGQAYLQMGHGARAALFWKRALMIDVACQEAWESLIRRNLLTSTQAYHLLKHEMHFMSPKQDWLRALYAARIEVMRAPLEGHEEAADRIPSDAAAEGDSFFSQPHRDMEVAILDQSAIPFASPLPTLQTPSHSLRLTTVAKTTRRNIPTVEEPEPRARSYQADQIGEMQHDVDTAFDQLWCQYKLQDAPQVLAMAARRAYRRFEWKAALDYCERLAQVDPAVSEAAYCYIATLVVLGRKRALFRLAHEWVDASPKSAAAWFAVGAYYYTCQRYHVAQRHFCRATRLEPQCTEAWIAFGCSFAACDESDQALASFRAAQRLSPGEHTSLLYMGMEYVRTNHLVLAHYFLQSALSASGGCDPLCLHELGVLAASKGEHTVAIRWFQGALASLVGRRLDADSTEDDSILIESIEQSQDPFWEPTLFNLGHSFRKTRQFDKAERCFARCVAMCPGKFSAYAALGFTQHLQHKLDQAISSYHQALGIKADDPFSTEMLSRALQEQANEISSSIFELPVERPMGELDHGHMSRSGRPSTSSMIDSLGWSRNDDSAMSEEMDDVDMSGAS